MVEAPKSMSDCEWLSDVFSKVLLGFLGFSEDEFDVVTAFVFTVMSVGFSIKCYYAIFFLK